MNSYTVYMHTFPNGKKYIGITCLDVQKRWKDGNGYKKQFVYNAIKKYGWNNIIHEILYVNFSQTEAETMEKYLISVLKTNMREYGYNIEAGGFHKGLPNEETREKIKASCKGKRHKFANRKSSKGKPIICVETGKIFSCAKEAQNAMGINASNIKHCCKHHKYYKTAGGFHWEFFKEVRRCPDLVELSSSQENLNIKEP